MERSSYKDHKNTGLWLGAIKALAKGDERLRATDLKFRTERETARGPEGREAEEQTQILSTAEFQKRLICQPGKYASPRSGP